MWADTSTKLPITRFILYQFSWKQFCYKLRKLKVMPITCLSWIHWQGEFKLKLKYLDWHIIWDGDDVCPSGGAAARRQRRPTLLHMLPSHHVGTHTVYRQPQQQPLYDSKVYTPKQSYHFCKNQKTAFSSSSPFWDVSSDWQLIGLNSSLSCFPFPFTSVCISAFLKSSAAC